MSSNAQRPPSLLGRLGLALAGLAFAAFFGGLCITIVIAPVHGGPAWAAWFLRGFVTLVFGGMAVGGLVFAYRALRGTSPRAIPRAVLERCPGCGEVWAKDGVCDACETSHASSAALWNEAHREGVGVLLFGGALGGGIVCLGLLIASHTLFEEKRVLMLAAMLGLALLLTAFGGVLMFGLAVALRDAWRARGMRDLSLRERSDTRAISASAHVQRGVLTLQGSIECWSAIEDAASCEGAPGALSPPLHAIARVVASLHARGDASLTFVERRAWSLPLDGEAGAVTREASVDVRVDAVASRAWGRALDVRDRVLQELASESLVDVAASVAASPDLAGAFERYAERVRTSEIDPHVHGVLVRVLLGGPSPASPYRTFG